MLGHHVAHSIEVASDYRVAHDAAVAFGLYVELRELSERGILADDAHLRINEIRRLTGARLSQSQIDERTFVSAMITSRLANTHGLVSVPQIASLGCWEPSNSFVDWQVEDAISKALDWLD